MGSKKTKAKDILNDKSKMNLADKIAALVFGGTAVAVVIALIIYLLVNSLLDKGYFARKTVAVTSDSYSVDNAMMSYFFYEEYRNFVNLNYDKLSDLNITADKSLKKQDCPYNESNWYDYFMDLAKENVTELISLAELAEDKNISLEDGEKDEIDYKIDELNTAAENSGKTETEYYAYLYGRGVTEKDVRACLELEMLAKKFHAVLYDGYELSEDDYEKAYNENADEYSVADVIKYTFTYSENAADITDYASFKNAMTADIIQDYKENYDTDITADFAESFFAQNITGTYHLGDDETIDKYVFEGDAALNQVFTAENDGKITAYTLVKEKYREDYATKNIRLIYCANDTYGGAEYAYKSVSSVYESLEEADMSVTRFASLAQKNSEDYESRNNGGLYRNFDKTYSDTAVTEWVYDESRKAGDCDIIEGENGYYIVYFEGDGLPIWKAGIKEVLFKEYLDKLYSSLDKEYNIEVNTKVLNKISA